MVRVTNRLLICLILGSLSPPVTTAALAQGNGSGKVRISGLADVQLGSLSLSGDSALSQSICVFSSTSSSTYSITAFGDGNGGSFSLTSQRDDIPIEVWWSDDPTQSGGVLLAPAREAGPFFSSARQQRCNSGSSNSASLTIMVREAAKSDAPAGAYTGQLTLIVAPN